MTEVFVPEDHPENPRELTLTVDDRPFLSPLRLAVVVQPNGTPLQRLTRVLRSLRPIRYGEAAEGPWFDRVRASVRAVRAGVPIGTVFVGGVRLEEMVAAGKVRELEGEAETQPPSVRLARHGRVVRVERNGTRRRLSRIHPNGGGTLRDMARADASAFIGADAVVSGHAQVRGLARVDDHALVTGDAVVEGSAVVRDRAYVAGSATVADRAVVKGHAQVTGSVRLAGTYVLGGEDRLDGEEVFYGVRR